MWGVTVANRDTGVKPETLRGGGGIYIMSENDPSIADMADVTIREAMWMFLLNKIGDETKVGFAERTGVKRSDVTNAANGRKPVSLGMLQKIARSLGRPGSQASDLLFELARTAAALETGKDRLPATRARRDATTPNVDAELRRPGSSPPRRPASRRPPR